MGPHFFGNEFKAYMEENGITHQKITLLWPQANSEAENFMKPLTKAIRSAHAEGRDWKTDLYRFMLNYRATPGMENMSLATYLSSKRLVQKLLNQMVIQSQKMMTKMTFLHKETHNPMCFQGIQFIQSVIDGIPSEPNIQSIVMVTIYTDSESVEQFICTG